MLLIVFVLTLTAFLFYIAVGVSGFGPIDDHQLVRTVMRGLWFSGYISPAQGRFIPFTAQEYNVASYFISPTAQLFHYISGIKVLLCSALLFRCLTFTKASRFLVAALWCTVILSIGFGNAAVRLQIGEINALLFLLIFVCSVQSLHSHATNFKANYSVLAIAVLAIGMAFMYKEVLFVIALAYSLSELWRNFRQNTGKYLAPSLLFLIATTYVLGYFIWRSMHVVETSYLAAHATDFSTVLGYFSINDPFLIFIILPVTAIRSFQYILRPHEQTYYDSLLIAGSAYVTTFLIMGMYNTYYLLPAYAVSACGLAGVWKSLKGRNLGFKFLLIPIIFFSLNNAPKALSDMLFLKSVANNHHKFVAYISSWIQKNPRKDSSPRRIVFSGVIPGGEVPLSMAVFLESAHLKKSSFKIIAAERVDGPRRMQGESELEDYKKRIGDLVVSNPYRSRHTAPPLISPSYNVIYSSDSDRSLPKMTLNNWILLHLKHKGELSQLGFSRRRYTGYTAALITRENHLPVTNARPIAKPSYFIESIDLPQKLKRGREIHKKFVVRNTGNEIWIADGSLLNKNYVHLSYLWLHPSGNVALQGNRFSLPEPLLPGDQAMVSVVLNVPDAVGTYFLFISPVQDGVQWFYSKTDKTGIKIDVY